MCRHCSADPSFRGFDLRVSPLGVPVVFAARGDLPLRRLPLGRLTFGLPLRGCPRRVGSSACRFGDCRSASWPSGSRLPLFGTYRFGVAHGELVLPPSVSAFAARRVDLRAHGFRFSARTASGLPLGRLDFGLTASAFRHAPLRGCCSASWPSGSPLPLFGMHRFGVALGELALPLGGLAFGLTASAFRHAPLRGCRSAG